MLSDIKVLGDVFGPTTNNGASFGGRPEISCEEVDN